MDFEQKYLKYKAKYLSLAKSKHVQTEGTLYNIHKTAGARKEIRTALAGKGINSCQATDTILMILKQVGKYAKL